MKKSNILIAVFTVIMAATGARAENVRVDFDGITSMGTMGKAVTADVISDLKIPLPDSPMEEPGITRRTFIGMAEVDKSSTFLELPVARRDNFRKMISSGNSDAAAKLLPLVDDKNIKSYMLPLEFYSWIKLVEAIKL